MCEIPNQPGCLNKGVIAHGVLGLKPKLIEQLLSRGCGEQLSPLEVPAFTRFESRNRSGTGYQLFKKFRSDDDAIEFLRRYLERKGDAFEVLL